MASVPAGAGNFTRTHWETAPKLSKTMNRRHYTIILNEETLQERIDKEVAKLERRLQAYNYETSNNKLAQLWRYLKSLGRGVTYLDAADFLRDSVLNKMDINWLASSRIGILEQRGWLKCIGRATPSPYFRDQTAKGARGAKLYEVCIKERAGKNQRALQRACDQLVANVELWDGQTNQVPNCMLDHLQPMKVRTPRDWDILDDRISDMTLNAIGKKHGITRERVRQIVDRAIR